MTRLNWDRDRRQRAAQGGYQPDAVSVSGFRDAKQRQRDAQRKADIERRSGEKQRAQKAKRRKEMRELRRQYSAEQRRLDGPNQRWLRRWRAVQQSRGANDDDA